MCLQMKYHSYIGYLFMLWKVCSDYLMVSIIRTFQHITNPVLARAAFLIRHCSRQRQSKIIVQLWFFRTANGRFLELVGFVLLAILRTCWWSRKLLSQQARCIDNSRKQHLVDITGGVPSFTMLQVTY